MKSILPIFALTVSGLVPATVTAQSKAEEQAAQILVVARELREAGKDQVAATLEAQARRILAGAKSVTAKKSVAATRPELRRLPAAVNVPRAQPRTVRDAGRLPQDSRSLPRVSGVGSAASAPRSRRNVPAPGLAADPTAPRAARYPKATGIPRAPGSGRFPRATGIARSPEAPRGSVSVGSRSVRNRALYEAPRTGESVADVSRDTLPSSGDARINIGRERFRYQPVPTTKDAKGRVAWRGLPTRDPEMNIRRPVATVPDASGQSLLDPRVENLHYNRNPKAVVVPSPDVRGTRFDPAATSRLPAGELESRVESLSAEVRAMRELLMRLSEQLAAERKAKKSNR